jgi:hypothetical protein
MGIPGIHAGHRHGRTGGVRRSVEGGGEAATGTGEATGKRRGKRARRVGDAAEGAERTGKGHAKGHGKGHRKRGCGGEGEGAAEGADTGAAALGQQAAATATGALTPLTADATTAEATAAPAADVAATAAAGPGAEIIQQVASQLGGSPLAQQVLSLIAQGGAAVNVVDDAAFHAKYGANTQGIYDPNTHQIELPQSVTSDPEALRVVLLHEGVHWVQDNAPTALTQLEGPLLQAMQGSGALAADDGSSQADEAQAFMVEALAAQELGIDDPGMGSSNGRALSYGSTLANVLATPEYQQA